MKEMDGDLEYQINKLESYEWELQLVRLDHGHNSLPSHLVLGKKYMIILGGNEYLGGNDRLGSCGQWWQIALQGQWCGMKGTGAMESGNCESQGRKTFKVHLVIVKLSTENIYILPATLAKKDLGDI